MIAFAFWGLLMGLVPLRENDLFWHLMLGRAVARAGARSFPEPVGLSTEQIAHAPEWLWELLMYRVTDTLGDLGLSVAVALGTASAAVSVPWMLGRLHPITSWSRGALWSFASALVVAVASVRVQHRPETVSMALIPVFMVLSVEFARRPGWRKGLTIAGLTVIWAQVHGLFVLGPVICAVVILTSSSHRRAAVGLVVGLAPLLFSSAYGLGVVDFLARHAAGDAVRHIVDMRPPPWGLFDPRSMVIGPLALIELWLAVLAGLRRRLSLSDGLLALLGVALMASSTRGMGPFALLAAPAAQQGLHALFVLWRVPVVGFSLAALLLGATGWRWHTLRGPVGWLGMDPESTPFAVYQALAVLPAGTAVLTSYSAGAGVGYFTDGRVKVTLDSRTPLQFSDLDFALARDAFDALTALRAYVYAKRVGGAVVERGRKECELVARLPGMIPVAVESRYAAFLSSGTGVRPLASLDVCRVGILSSRACGDDFAQDVDQLQLANPDFLQYLLAAQAIRCGGGAPSLALLSDWVSGRVLGGMRDEASLLASEGYALHGRWSEAADAVSRQARQGSQAALRQLLTVSSHLPADERRDVLADVCVRLDDACSPELQAALAQACDESGDKRCAEFHGARARLRGLVGDGGQ